MPDDLKLVLARQMEITPRFSQVDHHVGRIFDELEELGLERRTVCVKG